tara:strand:+ start:1013 stop:1171 length:159 start_codon:yes stop_codon:yes gene_type:complete
LLKIIIDEINIIVGIVKKIEFCIKEIPEKLKESSETININVDIKKTFNLNDL